jgi:hypothetical protein
MILFHIICFPLATLIFSVLSGLQANLFNMSLTLKWDSFALFTWSTQAWMMAIIGGVFIIECLRVGYRSDRQRAQQEKHHEDNRHLTITILNEAEIKYLYQLTHIYGIVMGAGATAGLWTLMSGLLAPLSLSTKLTTPVLSNIAFNCFMPILAIIIMMTMYKKSLTCQNFYAGSIHGDLRCPWTMKEPPPSSLLLMSSRHHDQLISASTASPYLPYYDRTSYSDYHTLDNASIKRHGHRNMIVQSRHQSSTSYFPTRIIDLQPSSLMRSPPIALQRGDRHMINYNTNNESSHHQRHRYSSNDTTANTSTTSDQTCKRALIGGQGLQVSAVGVRPCSLLSHGMENQEGRVNMASDYMSPRGSCSSGDGRGYIIEMYSVEESAYIDREIADSCDSRL